MQLRVRRVGAAFTVVVLLVVARPAALEPRARAARPRAARKAAAAARSRWRLPGDFERKQAVLLPSAGLVSGFPTLFASLVELLDPYVQVLVAVESSRVCNDAQRVLDNARVPDTIVPTCVVARHETMWLRDFGPLAVLDRRAPGTRVALVDAVYGLVSNVDDDVPGVLAKALHHQRRALSLMLEGGNLLSNGRGLLVTTRQVLEQNAHEGLDEPTVSKRLRRAFGAQRVVYLEPLLGEPTGHVDMLAAFVSPGVVAVASFDPSQDADNSALLDRNAARLARLSVDGKPLRVERVPMGHNTDGVWRSYLNVIFANGLLLVPTYKRASAAIQARALATWRRLMPRWRVVGLDASDLVLLGGTLHCISSTLPRVR